MRTRAIISAILLASLVGVYAFFSLPPVVESVFYVSYLAEYGDLIRRGLSVAIILVASFFASLVANLIITRAFPRSLQSHALTKKLLPLIQHIASVFVWIIAATLILSTLGVNISGLVTGAGIGGVMFALASKEAASNLFGSLSLIFSKNFKIGDTIRVKGYEGTVDEISLSYTRLMDKKGTVVFMPNKLIVSETIENLSMSGIRRAEFPFGLPASVDAKETEKCIDTLEKAVTKLEKTHGPLSPHVSIDGLTSDTQNLLLRIESKDGDMNAIKREVWMVVKAKLDSIAR